ncbi:MAG TPA: SurA N-terminal domain-containing protein [Longimicrobiales bacterium]|nr:SurA N-terminal domain-containing protein [Longimicrobiales bacterium]
MRENTKWIMLITAVAFVALMVFEWGMDMTGRGTQVAGGDIGRVNGEAISYEEWLAVYRNVYQQQQNAIDGPISSAMTRQIEDAAWDQIITQRLLQQELQRRGIRVTDEEIQQAAQIAPPPELQSAPVFQTDGQFDINKYHQFLSQPQDPAFLYQLEAYYRDVIPRSKLFFQTSAGLTVSDGQLWRMYRDANETVTVEYVAFDPATIVPENQVNVTDAAIRAYYEAHSDEFIRPAQVTVRYVSMNREAPPEDTAAARERAIELRTAAMEGAPFEEVAQRAADGSSNQRLYGELFTAYRGQSAPPLDQAVFSTPAGELTEPILTQAGYHVVKVESRGGDSAQVRQFVVPIELSRAAENRVLDRADSLEAVTESMGLEAAAQRLGLPLHTAELTPALPVLPGVGAIDEGLDWALENEPGSISDVMETDEAFYMLELVTRRDEGPLTLEEATPTIRAILLREGRIERARELLADAEKRALAGEPLQEIARARGARVSQAGPFTRGEGVPGLGRLNAAIGAAFALQRGQTSPLIEADGQLFLIRAIDRTEASRTAWQAQRDEQRARVLQALGDARWNQYLLALRQNAEIVDNRAAVLRGPEPEAAGL